ncbi:hypothetical protein N0V93_004971 [Gnomoniopsis smithogilvyi]|uniref:BTB domain-containing protein n=1 Tax=Gnomoniopsis smithogilvyi TaxID=1191159 RepID=A0A9W9CXM3_9PEZI|nr:hypothetical protein N0V93_004971 [Gnomoniopsis smithogilvyi]
MKLADANAMEQPSAMCLDAEGDLRLEVGEGEGKRSFVICSRALARVSKPFNAMLYGPFAESYSRKVAPDWTVALPEDDPEAFAIILQIVHSNFKMVPPTVSRDELYQITIWTDKYDMTEILQPWAQKWVDGLEEAGDLHTGEGELLWICWELGLQRKFVDVSQKALDSCYLDEESRLCGPHIERMQDNVHIVSLGILGHA